MSLQGETRQPPLEKGIRGWLTPRKEATRGAAEMGGWASFPYLHLHCKTPVADAPESSCRRRRGGPSFPGAKRPARPQGWGAQHSSCRGREGRRARFAAHRSSRFIQARARARSVAGLCVCGDPGEGRAEAQGFQQAKP